MTDPGTPPPIRRVREVAAFTNRFGTLYNDEVVSPAGVRGEYLRWRWSMPGVLAVPVHEEGVALVPAFRYPPGASLLEFPRGGAEPDEPVIAAALRELREEAGLRAESGELLGEVYAESGLIESATSVVLARVTDHSAGDHEPDAMESVRPPVWLTWSELRAAVAQGRVTCGLTLAALALVWARRS